MNAAVERLFSQHRLKKSGLICLFLILITLLSYWSYPAATLGEEDTQIYLAILLHRQDPLQLQRDIITQHPHTAFALFDEMVLFFANTPTHVQIFLALRFFPHCPLFGVLPGCGRSSRRSHDVGGTHIGGPNPGGGI